MTGISQQTQERASKDTTELSETPGKRLTMVILYHYTSHEGRAGIMQTGYVRESCGRGARYGEAVYLTLEDPISNSVVEIAKNNFDGAWKYSGRINKVQVALQFEMDASEVEQLDLGGDVWMYDDGDLPLAGYFTGRVYVADGSGGYREK